MSVITIYKLTDVDMTVNVTGIDLVDISDISISMEGTGNITGTNINFTMDDGDITISDSVINLRIEDNIISQSGIYSLRMTATENGNIRGLDPDPDYIKVV